MNETIPYLMSQREVCVRGEKRSAGIKQSTSSRVRDGTRGKQKADVGDWSVRLRSFSFALLTAARGLLTIISRYNPVVLRCRHRQQVAHLEFFISSNHGIIRHPFSSLVHVLTVWLYVTKGKKTKKICSLFLSFYATFRYGGWVGKTRRRRACHGGVTLPFLATPHPAASTWDVTAQAVTHLPLLS